MDQTAASSLSPMRMKDGDRWTMKCGRYNLEICRIGSSVFVSVLPPERSDFLPLVNMVIEHSGLITTQLCSGIRHVKDRTEDTETYKVFANVPPVQM